MKMSERRDSSIPVDVDKSDFEELVEYHRGEIRREVGRSNGSDSAPFYVRADDGKRMLAVGGMFALGMIGWLLLVPNPLSGVISGVIVAGVSSLFLTREGVAWRRSLEDHDGGGQQSQQQQEVSSSGPKRVCSECGWQNPQGNNFCHDCGSELE